MSWGQGRGREESRNRGRRHLTFPVLERTVLTPSNKPLEHRQSHLAHALPSRTRRQKECWLAKGEIPGLGEESVACWDSPCAAPLKILGSSSREEAASQPHTLLSSCRQPGGNKSVWGPEKQQEALLSTRTGLGGWTQLQHQQACSGAPGSWDALRASPSGERHLQDWQHTWSTDSSKHRRTLGQRGRMFISEHHHSHARALGSCQHLLPSQPLVQGL